MRFTFQSKQHCRVFNNNFSFWFFSFQRKKKKKTSPESFIIVQASIKFVEPRLCSNKKHSKGNLKCWTLSISHPISHSLIELAPLKPFFSFFFLISLHLPSVTLINLNEREIRNQFLKHNERIFFSPKRKPQGLEKKS